MTGVQTCALPIEEQAESVVEHEVTVTLLAERWDPRDAGLMW